MYRLLIGATFGVAWLTAPQVAAAADRAESLKLFQDMKAKAQSKLGANPAAAKSTQVGVTQGTKVPILSSKFNLDGTTPPDVKLGVKIWAELRDGPNAGKFVNPANYRWAPNERFWLWLETAAPVQLAIYQTYPDSIDSARQVVPDEKFPDSFKTVYPGEKFLFPIPFVMDPDGKTEYMAVLVARTDVEHLPLNNYVPPPPPPPMGGMPPPPPPPPPMNTITINNEVQVAMALNQGVIYKGTVGGAQKAAMTQMYRKAAKGEPIDGQPTKFNLAPPDAGAPPGSPGATPLPPAGTMPSTTPGMPPIPIPPDEAALLVFGAGKIGMQQLEMNKRRP